MVLDGGKALAGKLDFKSQEHLKLVGGVAGAPKTTLEAVMEVKSTIDGDEIEAGGAVAEGVVFHLNKKK